MNVVQFPAGRYWKMLSQVHSTLLQQALLWDTSACSYTNLYETYKMERSRQTLLHSMSEKDSCNPVWVLLMNTLERQCWVDNTFAQ